MQRYALSLASRNIARLLIIGTLLLSFAPIYVLQGSSVYAFSATIGTHENVDRAGVSVVRVLTTYTDSRNQSTQCTGLGVLIASARAAAAELNNIVLTDGSLVNPGNPQDRPGQADFISTCVKDHFAKTVKSIQVFVSNAYGSMTTPLATLTSTASVPGVGSNIGVICKNTTACSNDFALLTFHTDRPQPHIDTVDGNVGTQDSGIGLTKTETDTTPAPASPTADSNNP